jgi:hypothetical protein
MNHNGLLKGNGGKVDPKGITTREQAVLIAVRAYERFTRQDDGTGANSSTLENSQDNSTYFE